MALVITTSISVSLLSDEEDEEGAKEHKKQGWIIAHPKCALFLG
jgi:hypothetical protein